ncbi:MAG: ribosome-associated translation inhibitor RaiA [bacterium]|nr:ribosome-associated translation inhibitor RaiA [bacterium]MBK8129883.1 ribosome-associated translation inhibitor RaiA [bacterium]
MRTQITAVHFNATDSLQEFAENEAQRLLKFADDILHCEIEFSFNKQEKKAHVHISLDGVVLNASAITEDFRKSTVLAVDKLEGQVKKHKDKLQTRY